MKRALLAMASCLLLESCSPSNLKTITLSPRRTFTVYRLVEDQSFWCNFSLSLIGTAPPPQPPQGEVVSGFADFYDGGSGAFPCEEKQQTLARGTVLFDLDPFDKIETARLKFNIARSELEEHGKSTQQHAGFCYATRLGMATMPTGDVFWHFDNDVSLDWPWGEVCGLSFPPTYDLDLSSQVKIWTNFPRRRANDGFIIAGPILDFNMPADNIGKFSYYSDFQLQVTYSPALNPRAPQ